MDTSISRLNNSECSGLQQLFSPHCNLQEVGLRHVLGLKLTKSQSWAKRVPTEPRTDNVGSRHQRISEKLKASNFPMTAISIGNWQRVSRQQGELTAKLYFAKRKLVWEFLDGQLKTKMEVAWSDITAIKAVMHPDDQSPGILQIELGTPPSFFREITPQPRKHTNWQHAFDFTDGQAPFHRRHYAFFPPGVVEKHYEKLLESDQRLFELSKKPFIDQESSPYFNMSTPMPSGISPSPFNFNGVVQTYLPPQLHYHPNPVYPTPVWGDEAAYINNYRFQEASTSNHHHNYQSSEWGQILNHNPMVPNSYAYGISSVDQVMMQNETDYNDSWLNPHIQGPNYGVGMEPLPDFLNVPLPDLDDTEYLCE